MLRNACTSRWRYQPRSYSYLTPKHRLPVLQLPLRAHLSVGSQDISSSPLPPSFLSLYRLFLRSTAASVLNQAKATSTLRRQWRPIFTRAAEVIRRLETDKLPADQREALMCWLARWETRVDNTLSFLYSSAVARGVPHQVTRNLFRLEAANSAFIDPPPHLREGALWDGQLPPNDPKYQSGAASLWKSKGKGTQQKQKERLANAAMDTLSDLIGMAEGSGANGVSVLLGRVRRRR